MKRVISVSIIMASVLIIFRQSYASCLRPPSFDEREKLTAGRVVQSKERKTFLDYFSRGNPRVIYHRTWVGAVWDIIISGNGMMRRGSWFANSMPSLEVPAGLSLKKGQDRRETPSLALVFSADRLNERGIEFEPDSVHAMSGDPVPLAALTDECKRDVLRAISELPQREYPMPSKEKLALIFGFKNTMELEAFLGADAGFLKLASPKNIALREKLNRLLLWEDAGQYEPKSVIEFVMDLGYRQGFYASGGQLFGHTFIVAKNFEKFGLVQ